MAAMAALMCCGCSRASPKPRLMTACCAICSRSRGDDRPAEEESKSCLLADELQLSSQHLMTFQTM